MSSKTKTLSEKMQTALLHWFNTVGSGACGGSSVESMADLWKEHVPSLLLYLKSEGKERVLSYATGSSASSVYHDAKQFLLSSEESRNMAMYVNEEAAANGSELEISKFLLLFWHEICISDSKTIVNSISFMESVHLQDTMGDAIEWMNKATENQDYARWYYVLYENPNEEMDEDEVAADAGDATTPKGDESIERMGEETFSCVTPAHSKMRHSLYEKGGGQLGLFTPRYSSRRVLPIPSSEPRATHFVPPLLPHTRGSPIAEQLNSPAMREKRRERELRLMQTKLSAAMEDKDSKDIELKEAREKIDLLCQRTTQLKSKLDEKTSELTLECRLREEAVAEGDGLRREKNNLMERVDQMNTLIKKLKCDSDLSQTELDRLALRIDELQGFLSTKTREVIDMRDEMVTKSESLQKTMDELNKWKKRASEMEMKMEEVKESMDAMREDWKRRMEMKEEELIEIQSSTHQQIGDMNRQMMDMESQVKSEREEMDRERKKMVEEWREKKEIMEKAKEEREKILKEQEEMMKELVDKCSEMEVKMIEMEGSNLSLKQKLSAATMHGEKTGQESKAVMMKNEALVKVNEQMKETIEEMAKQKEEQEAIMASMRDDEQKMRDEMEEKEKTAKEERLSLMKKVKEMEEKNTELVKKVEKLTKEKSEASEKAYSALLENDKFTAMIEKMRTEEEERIKEEEWTQVQLRSQITVAEGDAARMIEEIREIEKKRDEEREEWEVKMKTITEQTNAIDAELSQLKFIQKNERKELKGLKREKEKWEEMRRTSEERKEKIERLERELEQMKTIGQENMENVVMKKKELEKELTRKEEMIERLNAEIAKMKEDRDNSMRDESVLSMTTMKRDQRGTLLPQKTLLDFDEEPTQLYTKSNLSDMREKKDFHEVDNTLTSRAILEKAEEEDDKENGLYLMTPCADRRTLGPYDKTKRMHEVASRNASTLPHLRSAYAVEAISPNFSQEGLREGVIRPASNKKRSAIKTFFHKKRDNA